MLVHHRRKPRPHWHWHFANFAVIVNLLMTAAMLTITAIDYLSRTH